MLCPHRSRFFSLCSLIAGIFAIGKFLVSWKIDKVADEIVCGMEAREVRGPFNAVEITLSQPRFLCFRILDYRSKTLEDILDEDIVGRGPGKGSIISRAGVLPLTRISHFVRNDNKSDACFLFFLDLAPFLVPNLPAK